MAKVFGIGLPKTGTSSLHAALGMLGYCSVHFPLSMEEIDEHDAASDITVASWFEELDKLYPESKFILTVRDIRKWLHSCERHFGQKVNLDEIPPKIREFLVALRLKVFGTVSYDAALFEHAYQRHMQCVQNYFDSRPQDLLIINICGGDGWEQLCPFLGHPTLNCPFPYENFACESIDMMVQEAVSKLK